MGIESPDQIDSGIEGAKQEIYEHYKRHAMKFNANETQAKIAAGLSPQEITQYEQAEKASVEKERDIAVRAARLAGLTGPDLLVIVDRALADARSEYWKSLETPVKSEKEEE